MSSHNNLKYLPLFSHNEILPTPFSGKSHSFWFENDSLTNYKKKPHPLFSTTSIRYEFNQHGYRCPEFNKRSEYSSDSKHVLSIGASEVFGYGLPESKTFSHIFTQKIADHLNKDVINWNLGVSGSSANYIPLILISALALLKPNIVLLTFPPGLHRREYISNKGKICSSNSRAKNKVMYGSIAKAHETISSQFSDLMNLYKMYQICENLCEKNDVIWAYSFSVDRDIRNIEPLLDSRNQVSPGIMRLRDNYKDDHSLAFARDFQHPGIKPNEDIAKMYFDTIRKTYGSRLHQL